MIRYSFYFFLFTFSFASCEKNISIKLDPTSTDLVVDASIENGKFPTVVLSRSLDYFSKIDIHVLAAHFVHGANVTISNGRVLAKLKEDSTQNDSSGLMLYYYTFNSADTGGYIVGEFNGKYDLRIEVENKLYTATTTIPTLAKFIDSLWWVPAPPSNDTGQVNVKARITDPPGLGNYTRYFTSVNNGPFYPGLTSVFDDQITDGTTYTVTVDQGVNRNASIDAQDYSFFHKGDSVTVELANIDKATFDFWRTMEYNYQSVGNPFSTPTEVISNVSNGALGYFGGYAAQYKHLKIPD
jgi:hypothetical protein